MVHIGSLPLEVFKMIFENLEPDIRTPHKQDLYNCIQVCRLWHMIAMPILYRQFGIYISAPPSENDIFCKYFSLRHVKWMRRLHVLITAGGQPYTTQQQCHDIIEYLLHLLSMVVSAENLEFVELDLFAFTPADCTADLRPALQPANELIVSLVRTVVSKRPALHIRLGRPELIAEAQVELFSLPVFNDIAREARGNFRSISVGCDLNWLLRWVGENHQLEEICYTKISSQPHEIEEFWDSLRSCQLQKLMLDQFEFPPIQRIPMGLVELILTHLDNTVLATNAILTHLPSLRLLSLRLERQRDEPPATTPKCVDGDLIVCSGLRKGWWTMSNAPEETVSVVSRRCSLLESLSPPRNVTDEDLISLSKSAIWLAEIWMMDCPSITPVGFRSLAILKHLKYLQLQIRFATFFTKEVIVEFLTNCVELSAISFVFEDSKDEIIRLQELLETIPGAKDYPEDLAQAMSFQASNLGDKVLFNIKAIRHSVV